MVEWPGSLVITSYNTHPTHIDGTGLEELQENLTEIEDHFSSSMQAAQLSLTPRSRILHQFW